MLTCQLVAHQIVLPTYVPSIVTIRQRALDPIFVPICVPTFVPKFVVPTFVPNSVPTPSSCPVLVPKSVLPTIVTFRQLNFVRHLVLNHFSSQLSHRLTNFCPLHLVHIAVSCHQMTTRTLIGSPPNTEMLPPCIGWECSSAGCVAGKCRAACSHARSAHKSALQSLDHQSASVQLSA